MSTTNSLDTTQEEKEHGPTISITTDNSSSNNIVSSTTTNITSSATSTKNNHLLKSFFLKIFQNKSSSNNSNELKRNQSFFDRFKRKKKDHNDDLSPGGSSSLSLNDLPDVVIVNDESDESDEEREQYLNNNIVSTTTTINGNNNTKKECIKNEKEYLYLYNYNSNVLNIYNKYNENSNELKCKYEINDHSDDINCILNFNFNLFTGSHDNSINYYKINTENGNLEFITKFQDETNTLESLSNYKNLNLISGSRDKIIRIRNLENFNLLTKLEGHTSWVHCVYGGCDDTLNPLYESHLFSSQRSTNLNESDIYIWNIENEKIVQKLHGHESTVYKMTQINSLLVSASQDSSVKLWDFRSNQLVGDLRGHNDWVKDVVTIRTGNMNGNGSMMNGNGSMNGSMIDSNMNGNEIVSCSMDGSIKLWDIRKMASINSTTTTCSTESMNNQSSSPLIETLYQNEEIGFTCIYKYNSNYWYFGSNQNGKLHLYDWKDSKLKELNLDKDITIDGIC